MSAEGPYRDLGEGFARLAGLEGARRGPSRVGCVEDALLELLRNARDAGASRVFVAASLRARRYRTLIVLDDGRGIPERYSELVFEPGVTTRHLDPVLEPAQDRTGGTSTTSTTSTTPHGAGLSLYHIRKAAIEAAVLSPASPTAIGATFDTRTLPERALQSLARPSRTNILATISRFTRENPNLALFHGSPPKILATLLSYRIIQVEGSRALHERARELGLSMSLRTVQRVSSGGVPPAERVGGDFEGGRDARRGRDALAGRSRGRGRESGSGGGGPVLHLGEEERAGIGAILTRAARAGYLEVEGLGFEVRPGEVVVRARVYEPEDPYE